MLKRESRVGAEGGREGVLVDRESGRGGRSRLCEGTRERVGCDGEDCG